VQKDEDAHNVPTVLNMKKH